jgi:hypothetical protein
MNNTLRRTLSIECFHGMKTVSIVCEFTENEVYLAVYAEPGTVTVKTMREIEKHVHKR